MTVSTSAPPLGRKARLIAQLVASLFFSGTVLAVNIPDTPLQTQTSAEPNVMMILDDSGSMQWEALPDDIVYTYFMFPRANGVYGASDYTNYTVDSNENNRYARFLRSSNNKLYYNPAILYKPWSNPDGTLMPDATPTAAYHNAADHAVGVRDLTVDTNNQSGYWLQDNGSFTGFGTRAYFPATYFKYNGGNVWSSGSYTKVEIRPANAPFTAYPARTDCAAAGCTYAKEIQNFANWYTYYRSRVLTARAGIGRAFAAQGTKLRTGFGAINKASTSVDGVNTTTIINGVRLFSGADRTAFFTTLYGHDIPAAGTPLRQGLESAGRYYSRTDSKGPWSSTPGVGAAGSTYLVCRQSYTILMTDGYWNGPDATDAGARANNDGTPGTPINYPDLPPYTQTYTYAPVSPYTDNRSNTLADVAMYYWKRDLNTNIANNVPTNFKDPAFWQHMVTFGVGLGVSGTINSTDAFAAVTSGAIINWPDPTGSNAAKLDDLLHASINGHGGFFSAQDPQQFADALTKTLDDIVNRSASASSVSANSTQLVSGAKVYNAKYDTSKWSGELEALPINSAGVSDIPAWKASEHIPAPGDSFVYTAGSRKIFTTSGGTAVPFLWNNLSGADQALLANNSDILGYIRGIRLKEQQNAGGTLRNRTNILGDIVHSSPFYVQESDSVFIGANDGMLHAFNATNGTELFAYIPSSSIPKLFDLTQPSYSHKYFVDGDIAVSTTAQTPGRNYLVGSLGRGGKGLFGLDVTTPASFGTANVLWENFGAADPDVGYMLGRPSIAKMNDGSMAVIVGNGYNSTNKNAVLYIYNLSTGALIRKIDTGVGGDNGLAAPGLIDADNDGDIDYIYAGDLKGNVWKFDVSSNNSALWDSALKSGAVSVPLFVAKDPSNNTQPITAPITVAVDTTIGDANYGKRFVFFGTGSFQDSADQSSLQIQSWYGLIDEGLPIANRASLVQRSLLAQGTVNGFPVRTFSAAVPNDMVGKSGWYIDLKLGGFPAEGERMVTASKIYKLAEPTLIASSMIPVVDPCIPGGKGYLNAISPFTGGRLTLGFFDLNGDSNFSNDGLAGINAGSVDLGGGMPSEPIVIGNRVVVGGSGGAPKSVLVNTGGKKSGRLSWREILRN